MNDVVVQALQDSGLSSEAAILQKRPYVATTGRHKGRSVIAVNTGRMHPKTGEPVYAERPISVNATLRKDEWIDLEETIIESARERLVIVDDLRNAGLTYNVGGLGTIVSEWETASEITDAEATMDGESTADRDRQEFGLNGVPIPVIQKPFRIGERQLLASRNRGAALDVTTGTEAGRAVSRTSEDMVINGLSIPGGQYKVHGLLTFPGRARQQISDWTDEENVTNQDILDDILGLVQVMETEERHYGPFNLYIAGDVAFRFRQDFKAEVSQTLMERVMSVDAIANIRIADKMPSGNVSLVQMERTVWDLAVASDITTVQWQSGSGWTNHFQTFAAWAPRFKQDYDGRTGVMHGSVAAP